MYPNDRALLVIGESFNTADLYYVTRFLFPDPVIYVDKGDSNSLVACGDFERDNAAAHSKAARVRPFRDYGVYTLPTTMPGHERTAELALRVLQDEGVTRAITTNDIPLFVADFLVRPTDYRDSLVVCPACGALLFDTEARVRGACVRHEPRRTTPPLGRAAVVVKGSFGAPK